ncbi:MAG: ABC transporter substrate-binding protein [Candidatus Hermodarchaeota archaeon]
MNLKKVLSLALVVGMVCSLCFRVLQPAFAQKEYLFATTLITFTNDPVQVQQAQLVARELRKIGIDCRLVQVGWDALIPRMFGSLTHASYANGGFDIGLIDWTDPMVPSAPFHFFHSSNIDPASWASNYYPVKNKTLDGILEFTMNTTDFKDRKEYIRQALEVIVWEIHPVMGIYQEEVVYYMRDNIRNFDPNWFPNPEEYWFVDGQSAGHGNVNEFIVASTTQAQNYNPFFSNLWYKDLASAPVFNSLVEGVSNLNLVAEMANKLPYPVAIKNNYTGVMSSTDPNTATVWEVELRDDIYWHEGYGYTMMDDRDVLRFDADDVVWNYKINIDDNGPPNLRRSYFQFAFGTDFNNAIIKVDNTHVQFHLRNLYADLFTLFSFAMLPQHILDPMYDAGYGAGIRKDGSTASRYINWRTDDYNQGVRTDGYAGSATIGTGAYIFYPGVNRIQQTVTLTKWNHYWKDNDSTYWGPLVKKRFDKYIYTWITNKEVAEIALEKGDIDFMDTQYQIWKDYPVMSNKPGIVAKKQLSWSYQTMGYNILNGADSKLSSKWVRLAISHMIPQQDIIDYLFNGLGQQTFVPFPKQSPFWPETLKPIVYNYSKALEYMKKAGYAKIQIPPPETSGFEILAFVFALSGMTTAILVYRYRKRVIKKGHTR